MFRSALIKLTLLYLLVIMVISFFFSLNLYRISGSELDYNLSRQQNAFQRAGRLNSMMQDGPDMMKQIRQQQLKEGNQRILFQLLYTNIVILVAGGGISYLLARITLKPIEEAHESQKRFTGDASHELRSPLAVMKSEIEVALRDPKITKEGAVKILKSNLEEVDRLKNLSEGLLELANGRDRLEFSSFEIGKLVEKVERNLTNQLKDKKVKLVNNVGTDIFVFANEPSVIEIITILIDNALKYGGEGDVEIRAIRSGRLVEVSVIDNGQGIDERDIPFIFDRFYRSERSRTKNKADGYGLGLSIAKQLAEKNHGHLEAISRQGEGSTFKLFLRIT